jgi:hypothetical protein
MRKDILTFSVLPKKENIDEDSKMILWRLSYLAEVYCGRWHKALINCLPCMASVHSVYFYWYFMPFTFNNFILYLFYVPILSFVNMQTAKIC